VEEKDMHARYGDVRTLNRVENHRADSSARRKDFQLAKDFRFRVVKTSDGGRILRTVVATELAQ
jgi:hypothetical protein